MKTCAFTGHRPQHLLFGMNENDDRCVKLKEALKEQIINLIEAEDVTHFITGMALGVDLYAAEIVLDLKARYPNITLESAIPCETQAVKWSMAQRERYYDIAAQCDKETMLQSHYSPDCIRLTSTQNLRLSTHTAISAKFVRDLNTLPSINFAPLQLGVRLSLVFPMPLPPEVANGMMVLKSGVSIKAGGNRESLFASEKSICYPAIIWMMNHPHCSA